VPGSGGSGLSVLRRVRDYLAADAPGEVSLIDAAIEATQPYVASNNGVASARYAALSTPQRDAHRRAGAVAVALGRR
jgi:erythromycin esterase